MGFLDFEQPIAELEEKIEELRYVSDSKGININDEINRLKKKSVDKTQSIYSNLTPWQISKVARHPDRPYTLDYIKHMVDEFEQLHGDRARREDPAMVCGIGKLGDYSIVIIGHQKGRDVQDRIYRNYGMPRPEGYRKARRAMKLAERFGLPLVTLIDTPGAYPGVDAEENGQSEAIANNLLTMAELSTPIISVVVGEGGSGGALAIGVTDHLAMLQYSTYSVISPEGCASILWKKADKAPEAAKAMKITASELHAEGLVDTIIQEPAGGAHRDIVSVAASLKTFLLQQLDDYSRRDISSVLEDRRKKYRVIGRFVSFGE